MVLSTNKSRADTASKIAAVEAFYQRRASGEKVKEIAQSLGITSECLRNWVKQVKDGSINRPAYGELSEDHKIAIKDLLSLGFADTNIAQRLGLHNLKVYYYRKTIGVTREQVVENRYNSWEELLKKGASFEQVAELYGANPNSMYKTLHQKRGFRKKDSLEQ